MPGTNSDTAAAQPAGKMDKCVAIVIGMRLDDAEREIILATLNEYGGNKRRTATVLGISLKTLYNRLAAYQSSGALSAFMPGAVTIHPLAAQGAEGMTPLCSQDPAEGALERREG